MNEEILRYLHGECPPAERSAIEARIASDAGFRREYEDAAAFHAGLRELFDAAARADVPDNASARAERLVCDAVRFGRRRARPEGFLRRAAMHAGLPLAACAVFMFAALSFVRDSRNAPGYAGGEGRAAAGAPVAVDISGYASAPALRSGPIARDRVSGFADLRVEADSHAASDGFGLPGPADPLAYSAAPKAARAAAMAHAAPPPPAVRAGSSAATVEEILAKAYAASSWGRSGTVYTVSDTAAHGYSHGAYAEFADGGNPELSARGAEPRGASPASAGVCRAADAAFKPFRARSQASELLEMTISTEEAAGRPHSAAFSPSLY